MSLVNHPLTVALTTNTVIVVTTTITPSSETTTDSSTTTTTFQVPFLQGALLGVVIAVLFALVVRQLPTTWFTPKSVKMAILLALGLASAAPFVWVIKLVTRKQGAQLWVAVIGGNVGAMTFDSLAISFAPATYNQVHMGSVGALLLWGVSCIFVVGAFMTGQVHH